MESVSSVIFECLPLNLCSVNKERYNKVFIAVIFT